MDRESNFTEDPYNIAHAKYKVMHENDLFILIQDLNSGMTITEDAHWVIQDLSRMIPICLRKVFYVDTCGHIDQLFIEKGQFTGFVLCTYAQQEFLTKLAENVCKAV